jgi:hypothetical protein
VETHISEARCGAPAFVASGLDAGPSLRSGDKVTRRVLGLPVQGEMD